MLARSIATRLDELRPLFIKSQATHTRLTADFLFELDGIPREAAEALAGAMADATAQPRRRCPLPEDPDWPGLEARDAQRWRLSPCEIAVGCGPRCQLCAPKSLGWVCVQNAYADFATLDRALALLSESKSLDLLAPLDPLEQLNLLDLQAEELNERALSKMPRVSLIRKHANVLEELRALQPPLPQQKSYFEGDDDSEYASLVACLARFDRELLRRNRCALEFELKEKQRDEEAKRNRVEQEIKEKREAKEATKRRNQALSCLKKEAADRRREKRAELTKAKRIAQEEVKEQQRKMDHLKKEQAAKQRAEAKERRNKERAAVEQKQKLKEAQRQEELQKHAERVARKSKSKQNLLSKREAAALAIDEETVSSFFSTSTLPTDAPGLTSGLTSTLPTDPPGGPTLPSSIPIVLATPLVTTSVVLATPVAVSLPPTTSATSSSSSTLTSHLNTDHGTIEELLVGLGLNEYLGAFQSHQCTTIERLRSIHGLFLSSLFSFG